jgi:aspartate carbamoyltransferase catalytic subunit
MRRHLLSIDDLSRDDIERILGRAESFAEVSGREIKKVPTLRGRTVINLFYEASTRTSSSFELAAKRLSADLVSIKSTGSAVDKGESLKDTVQTLSAYDPAAIVIRSPHAGAAALVARWTRASVINAGDGKHEHPTQALLDLYTLRRRIDLEGLRIWIVGDVLHSRVARSGILESLGCRVRTTLDDLPEADVVYALRMQHERMDGTFVPSLREYAAQYQIDGRRLRPNQLLMHPGPVNRGVELAAEVIDSPQALIVEQVESGVVVRMAVLYELLAGHGAPSGVRSQPETEPQPA